VLDELRALGVELAIDDFGTGYSSLSSLSRLPINSLKIDASFVRELKPGNKQAEIVKAVVSLGSLLGKSIVAEGIETDSQMAMLDEMGCEGGQGYLLSKPLSAEDIDTMLEQHRFEVETEGELMLASDFSPLTKH
jgi:EAL domain-containing protein (putative c-di-GMP-specific phosphodiesterase class I)